MTSWSTPSVDDAVTQPPQSGLRAVRRAVSEADAVGFVHVGGRADTDRRYLTRVDGPDRETAVVFLPGDDHRQSEAVYCVPSDTVTAATGFEREAEIGRRVEGRQPTTATGQQVCAVLADRYEASTDGVVLVPRTLPHDTAVFLQEAGYELASTTVLTSARITKTPPERDCIERVQAAAATGIARGEAVLAASEPVDGQLVFDGRPLTSEGVRRLVDAELASAGVSPAANTTVEADTDPAGQLPAGEPIQLAVAPRGPHGYHGRLTRTLAVDSDGGWERRAYIAAEAGLQAAGRHVEPGVAVSTVESEAVAEVGAYGFAVTPDAADASQPRATATVHGVGLSAYEPPAVGMTSQLRDGAVIVIETGVVDPTRGELRLGTLVTVSEEGMETLVEYPYSLTPVDRLSVEE